MKYHLDVVRDGSLMVSVAVPGERWEIEFSGDATTEIERFTTDGVEQCTDPLALVLEQYE